MIPIPDKYRTKRLVARPYENTPGDRAFLFTQIDNDPTNAALNMPSLALPLTEQEIQGAAERVTKGILFKSFCLPPETGTTSAAPTDRDLDVQEWKNRMNSLTPIGLLYARLPDGRDIRRTPHRCVDIGVTLATDYQDESYVAEIVHWALYWAFRHLQCPSVRVRSVSSPDGLSYAGLGFFEEGREADYFGDGSGREVVSYRMLKQDWKAPKKSQDAPYVHEGIEAHWENKALGIVLM